MNASTVDRLNSLNRDFYRRYAHAFDEKRQQPWPGWKRIAALLADVEEPSILDLGCGNGRFGRFLLDQLGGSVDYLGIDVSPELLRIAAARSPTTWRWIESDFVAVPLAERVVDQFDLATCFGVMHHVPGETTRRVLLESLVANLHPGGYLAVSFWPFGSHQRFTQRALAWNRGGGELAVVDPSALEENDFLLPWGGSEMVSDQGSRPLRYCHWVDLAEAERLVATLGLERVDTFAADGRTDDLNHYEILRRPAS